MRKIEGERFLQRSLYVYPNRSKLSNNFLEKKLNIIATTRNFNTLTKLVGMVENGRLEL